MSVFMLGKSIKDANLHLCVRAAVRPSIVQHYCPRHITN